MRLFLLVLSSCVELTWTSRLHTLLPDVSVGSVMITQKNVHVDVQLFEVGKINSKWTSFIVEGKLFTFHATMSHLNKARRCNMVHGRDSPIPGLGIAILFASTRKIHANTTKLIPGLCFVSSILNIKTRFLWLPSCISFSFELLLLWLLCQSLEPSVAQQSNKIASCYSRKTCGGVLF